MDRVEEEKGGRLGFADRAATPAEPSPAVSGKAGITDAVETVTVPREKWVSLIDFYDKQVGTPCAEIRWQDRECELLAHVCGNASMEDWRIDEMDPDAMRDLLKYLAKDARRLSGYEDPKDAHAWVEAYADGRV